MGRHPAPKRTIAICERLESSVPQGALIAAAHQVLKRVPEWQGTIRVMLEHHPRSDE
jgi:hypothetical protein